MTQPIENALAASAVGMVRLVTPGLSVASVFFREGSGIHQNRQVAGERPLALANQLPRAWRSRR